MKAVAAIIAVVAAGAVGAQFMGFGASAPAKELPDNPKVAYKTSELEAAKKKGTMVAMFGGGCFWCTERDFRKIEGVVAADVGYSGGHKANPTYQDVLTKTTGHVEVTRVEWDPEQITFRQVCDAFFQMHDPTQVNRQGPDVGEQYRSVIYYYTPEQKKIAEEAKAAAGKKYSRPIATTIEPAKKYWRAEEYHQQYYLKKGIG